MKEDPGAYYKEILPELLTGFGETGSDYRIKLKKEASSVSVNTTHRVSFALLEKVEIQLKEMVQDGIIERVREPTP